MAINERKDMRHHQRLFLLRDEFPVAVVETLGKRVGMRCSNPGCRLPTSGPREEPTKAINVGVAAHISAASPGGPRYDPAMTSHERRAIENGIWLCQTCAKLVDSDAARYTVLLLRNWKNMAEESARNAIESPRVHNACVAEVDAWWWTGCLADGISENPDSFMTVVNRTAKELPWLNVHVFPSNTFQLEPRERFDRLMQGQYAIYRFRMLETDGHLTKWALRFSELKRDEVSIRVFPHNSIGGPVLISFDLGAELHDRISSFKAFP